MEIASERPWASLPARTITIVLLVLQLASCAVDLTTEQASLISIFCMATVPENAVLEFAALAIWLTLAFSWIVGAFAVRVASLRPIYWLLLMTIPIAFVTQNALLQNKVVFCDAP